MIVDLPGIVFANQYSNVITYFPSTNSWLAAAAIKKAATRWDGEKVNLDKLPYKTYLSLGRLLIFAVVLFSVGNRDTMRRRPRRLFPKG